MHQVVDNYSYVQLLAGTARPVASSRFKVETKITGEYTAGKILCRKHVMMRADTAKALADDRLAIGSDSKRFAILVLEDKR